MRPGTRDEPGADARPPEAARALGNTAAEPRILSIDRLRGVLVILMVGGVHLAGVEVVPAFLKHAPDIGLTIADTVAPAFVFVIGLNYGPSFARRMRRGTAPAVRHFVVRYLALIGIGAIIAAGATTFAAQPTDWGVLQAIGVAGLICLPAIRLPAWARFGVGLLVLWGYQVALDAFMLPSVLHSVQGGLFGALSWGALLLMSTAVADVWRSGLRPYGICCALLVVAAAIAAVLVPVSKVRVSLSYVLVTLAISALVFLAFDLASRVVAQRPGFFCWWGENALALYVLHLVILAIVVVPPVAWWYVGAPYWLAAAQLAVILAVLSAVAWWAHRRGIRMDL
jgi:predicted acyltransferase